MLRKICTTRFVIGIFLISLSTSCYGKDSSSSLLIKTEGKAWYLPTIENTLQNLAQNCDQAPFGRIVNVNKIWKQLGRKDDLQKASLSYGSPRDEELNDIAGEVDSTILEKILAAENYLSIEITPFNDKIEYQFWLYKTYHVSDGTIAVIDTSSEREDAIVTFGSPDAEEIISKAIKRLFKDCNAPPTAILSIWETGKRIKEGDTIYCEYTDTLVLDASGSIEANNNHKDLKFLWSELSTGNTEVINPKRALSLRDVAIQRVSIPHGCKRLYKLQLVVSNDVVKSPPLTFYVKFIYFPELIWTRGQNKIACQASILQRAKKQKKELYEKEFMFAAQGDAVPKPDKICLRMICDNGLSETELIEYDQSSWFDGKVIFHREPDNQFLGSEDYSLLNTYCRIHAHFKNKTIESKVLAIEEKYLPATYLGGNLSAGIGGSPAFESLGILSGGLSMRIHVLRRVSLDIDLNGLVAGNFTTISPEASLSTFWARGYSRYSYTDDYFRLFGKVKYFSGRQEDEISELVFGGGVSIGWRSDKHNHVIEVGPEMLFNPKFVEMRIGSRIYFPWI